MEWLGIAGLAVLGLYVGKRAWRRLELSRAKHGSLAGHSKMARRVAKLVPFYDFDEASFFRVDGAPEEVATGRREGFFRLKQRFQEAHPRAAESADGLEQGVSDLEFTNHYRVPFQFRTVVRHHLGNECVMEESSGRRLRDPDGNWSYDLSGSYGVNVFGYEFYKQCIDAGVDRARALGPVLGPYHPALADNVRRLKAISGQDEVSFHMSGTEAVMQAVRLARYHTGRPKLVRFCGAYHGWWDGVQPGVGNPRKVHDVFTLRDMDRRTLQVLRTRTDIACVLVNPQQAFHPNRSAASDSFLVSSKRSASFLREEYAEWLRQLRDVCTERGIVLILDDVFLGFRFAVGGTQEFYGVRADLVTYGKTLGGGLPVGVVCGKRQFMRRFREDRPTDICFARGTFNSHPYVVATMNEFLRRLDTPEIRAIYDTLESTWDGRAQALNECLEARGLPVRIANMVSVWTTLYTEPSRYNWMFQFYLRAEGLVLSWIGTGRFLWSHDYTDADFREVMDRFVRAAEAMRADGWWWRASAEVTDGTLQKKVLGELVRVATRRKPA